MFSRTVAFFSNVSCSTMPYMPRSALRRMLRTGTPSTQMRPESTS